MLAVACLYVGFETLTAGPEAEEDREIRERLEKEVKLKSTNSSVVNVFINPKTGEWQRDHGQDKPKY